MLSVHELFDIILMTLAIGFIFSDFFKPLVRKDNVDVLDQYTKKRSFFDWESMKIAAMVGAPAIILHEFGHKFVAMAMGLSATFQAAYMFLAIGVILKLMKFPFLIIVPAYVAISGGTHTQMAITAIAGPLVNGMLWLISSAVVKNNLVAKRYIPYFLVSAKINLFLAIFNMLPIPGFDGFQFFKHLLSAIA